MHRLAGVKLCVCVRWWEHLCVMAAVKQLVTTGAIAGHSIQITATMSTLQSPLWEKLGQSPRVDGQEKKTHCWPTCFMWNTFSWRHVIYRLEVVCIRWLSKITSQRKAAIYLIKNGRDWRGMDDNVLRATLWATFWIQLNNTDSSRSLPCIDAEDAGNLYSYTNNRKHIPV